MKRIEQLQNLSREHHQSLSLAQKAIKTHEAQNAETIEALCQTIVQDYPLTWMKHFQVEEETIFALFSESKTSEVSQLCQLLEQEHRQMDVYYEQMKNADYTVLGDFGILLKKHTRMEERQLFPLLEDVMTEEQLQSVFSASS
ncbi:hemerythrin domain-containing protein [sulfur-oxidizing endosymbiont of Gigantopelta aegis]|uniref:hemerythrin domain-containing protein n=1 Tax=sulfur-oxidizing endosymbiont of Gigantopelta aegis TaxID=2794934 RepID=UPI0018DE8657|nr:hemerythrin domain-containing protein [sulfur-oxidizing endosymbiont of Gigantopelta aegis]